MEAPRQYKWGPEFFFICLGSRSTVLSRSYESHSARIGSNMCLLVMGTLGWTNKSRRIGNRSREQYSNHRFLGAQSA